MLYKEKMYPKYYARKIRDGERYTEKMLTAKKAGIYINIR